MLVRFFILLFCFIVFSKPDPTCPKRNWEFTLPCWHKEKEYLSLPALLISMIEIQLTISYMNNKIKSAIKVALEECEKEHIKGNKITPYLLKKINDLTGGESCETNVKLVINNYEVLKRI